MSTQAFRLSQLATGDIARLRCSVPALLRVQVHPFYFGFDREDVRMYYEQFSMAMLEFGERPALSYEAELARYARYQVRRRRHVRGLKDAWGVLCEEEQKIQRTLEVLADENPSMTWLVVATNRGSWMPHGETAITEPQAWERIAAQIQELGPSQLEIFGALSGTIGHCVTKTAAYLSASRRFAAVSINPRATLG